MAFEHDGGMVAPRSGSSAPTWTNTSGSSKWIQLGDGLKQFASPDEQVELTDDIYAEMRAAAGT